MAATATVTHRITVPKKVSAFLTRKAKEEKTTLSGAIATLIEEHNEMLDAIEDRHLSMIADERVATSDGKYLPSEEFWKLAHEVPYNP